MRRNKSLQGCASSAEEDNKGSFGAWFLVQADRSSCLDVLGE